MRPNPRFGQEARLESREKSSCSVAQRCCTISLANGFVSRFGSPQPPLNGSILPEINGSRPPNFETHPNVICCSIHAVCRTFWFWAQGSLGLAEAWERMIWKHLNALKAPKDSWIHLYVFAYITVPCATWRLWNWASDHDTQDTGQRHGRCIEA